MTLEQALADSIAPRRFNLFLLGTFAAAALLLALIGIYGVITYSVAQRTYEIGVRMALGARRSEVVRMVVRQGMGVVLAGILIGLAAAFALTRVMESLLYEVETNGSANLRGRDGCARHNGARRLLGTCVQGGPRRSDRRPSR